MMRLSFFCVLFTVLFFYCDDGVCSEMPFLFTFAVRASLDSVGEKSRSYLNCEKYNKASSCSYFTSPINWLLFALKVNLKWWMWWWSLWNLFKHDFHISDSTEWDEERSRTRRISRNKITQSNFNASINHRIMNNFFYPPFAWKLQVMIKSSSR